jgi:cytoskeletal protein RodZ
VVLVVFGALAFVGSRRSSHHATIKTSITTVAGHHPTPVHHGSTTPTTSPKPTKPTPTTTTKPPTQLVATSSTAASATYSVSSTSYDVTITADGTCWVDATNVSSGSTVWTGTLQPGASQVIHATGAIHVELGRSIAAMSAEDIPVILPSPMQAPFTATFEPSPAAASTATTATTTP